jgi:hypothetical protein
MSFTPTTSIDASGNELPPAPTLEQNYPNPFNPSTTIAFSLPRASEVKLGVFDLLGRELKVLVQGRREGGVHAVTLDARGMASGMYLYRLEVGGEVKVRSLLVIR